MKVLTFGEIMIRLKAPGRERLFQSAALEATFGGAEANVAVSLANFGAESQFLTVLPSNELSKYCVRELRYFGVDTSKIVYGNGRLGSYYLEAGVNQLPSKVIYDREYSSMALAASGSIDFGSAFDGIDAFHLTGITPALSQNAADLSLEALKTAKRLGVKVFFDVNYRKNLWKYGADVTKVLKELANYVDVLIASEDEIKIALGIEVSDANLTGTERYKQLCDKVLSAYPEMKAVACITYSSLSAEKVLWSACLGERENFCVSREYEISDALDRVGTGDAFAAGLIYGLGSYEDSEKALEFATAASCLKHSVSGDFNRVTVSDVQTLMDNGGAGKLQR